MSGRPIVLAAGGTGGHIFPAEALARELLARGRAVALVTDRRGQAFGDRMPGVALHRIRAGRLGAGLVGKVTALAETALGVIEATRLLRRLDAAAVVGFGGYPSVPTVLAAARLKLPALVHEQNAVLGRANRLLAPRAGRVATSFAEVAGLGRARATLTGNPVRPAIAALADAAYAPPDANAPIELLIVGGSQGARILGTVVPAALALLPAALKARLRVTQQARPEDLDAARAAYGAAGIAAETAAFFDDIPARLARAHLVVARAGASTVAELAAVGRPALLVPYRFAADDHQSANAAAFVRTGAAWAMAEAEFTAAALAQRLGELLAAPQTLREAAVAARRLGRPDAARALADLALALAGGNGGARPVRENAA